MCLFSKIGRFEECEYVNVDVDVLESNVTSVNILGKEFTRELDEQEAVSFKVRDKL
jgi:hypothetical protein